MVVDYYSKYIEIAKLHDTSSKAVIVHLKSIFARLGIPYVVYSDNGPQFQSTYFKDFATNWNFEHKTSSPRYPQSNGLVERYVGIIKQMLKKCEYDGKDMYLALLEYRNTPITDKIPSPTELMYGMKIRGLLPTLNTRSAQNEQTQQLLKDRQNTQIRYYNRSAKDLNFFKAGDQVLVKRNMNSPLQPATVVNTCDRPRSYKLEFTDGILLDRNRRHIHQTPSQQKVDKRNWELEQYHCSLSEQDPHIKKDSNQTPIDLQTVQNQVDSSNMSNIDPDTSDMSAIRTRPSRIVKPPAYFKDYVMY